MTHDIPAHPGDHHRPPADTQSYEYEPHMSLVDRLKAFIGVVDLKLHDESDDIAADGELSLPESHGPIAYKTVAITVWRQPEDATDITISVCGAARSFMDIQVSIDGSINFLDDDQSGAAATCLEHLVDYLEGIARTGYFGVNAQMWALQMMH